jgi:predicted TIM-barrel fold metal-dependent hydrolase
MVVDETIADLRDPTDVIARRARELGLDPAQISNAGVQIEEDRQGADPIFTMIVVTLGVNVAAHVLTTIWDDLLWPRIKRRLGANAVGGSVDPR